MDTTMSEVVQFIQENDVKFIRLAFCDIFGNQKNIAIMPTELERAFEQGIHFNAAALRGFLNVEAYDLLLFPDPATLSVPVSYTHLDVYKRQVLERIPSFHSSSSSSCMKAATRGRSAPK